MDEHTDSITTPALPELVCRGGTRAMTLLKKPTA